MEKNVYNSSKLAFNEGKIKSLAEKKITSPIYVRFKPTNKCNHRCYYCSYQPDNECPVSQTINFNDEIPREKMIEILDDFKNMGVKAITYSGGGEPLVYPHIIEMLKKTIENGIELSIITNGQMLKGEIAEILKEAEWVRISADSPDKKTFVETRRIDGRFFHELVENIKNFSKIKKPECELGINFVVQEKNAGRVYNAVRFFKNLGVNHIKITPCWMPNFLEYHEPFKDSVKVQIEKAREDFQDENFRVYDTYKNDFEIGGLNERPCSKCYMMQVKPVVAADCVVYSCQDKAYNEQGIIGSLKNTSFKELWFSDKAKEKFDNFNPKINCRHHCTGDARNAAIEKMMEDLDNLDKYKPSSDKHKNFV